ncbi:MAG: methyltransferase domain-containing protein [Cryobacterium sp.]|nr:methyltransferase domain-containing protein [Cryobacterium sp.]
MGFDIPAEAYDRFMGRYSRLLSVKFADFAGIHTGQRALDVGCGPGALTAELVCRLGAESVIAIDPSASFVTAARERQPHVDIREAVVEDLPFPDDCVDVALAQLVVHFLTDPVKGLTEMQRVVRSGGIVAADVWDFVGERAPHSTFWHAARTLDPAISDESQLPGAHEGSLSELFAAAGLGDIVEVALELSVQHRDFEEWWTPYTGGVGPAGAYFASLAAEHRTALREQCRSMLPDGPFTLVAHAWAARGTVR